MRRLRRASVLALAILAATAVAAHADQTIYAIPQTMYFMGDITINQGDKVTFTNLDTLSHDVTAKAAGTDGKPLFGSAVTSTAGSSPVVGTEYLTTGTYNYFCSIHPFMTGTITVTSNGTPAPRPGGAGSGSGGPAPSSAPSSQAATAPTIHVNMLDTKLAGVRRHGALRVGVSSDQPTTVAIAARSGKTTVASGTARLSKAGSQVVSLKLTKAGARLVGRARSLRLILSARAPSSGPTAATANASTTLR